MHCPHRYALAECLADLCIVHLGKAPSWMHPCIARICMDASCVHPCINYPHGPPWHLCQEKRRMLRRCPRIHAKHCPNRYWAQYIGHLDGALLWSMPHLCARICIVRIKVLQVTNISLGCKNCVLCHKWLGVLRATGLHPPPQIPAPKTNAWCAW